MFQNVFEWNYIKKINKSALCLAVELDEKDIVKLLLSQNQIDINIKDV